jgi:hypothetical protein
VRAAILGGLRILCYLRVTASCNVRTGCDGLEGVAMTVTMFVVELGCEIVAEGVDEDCIDPPPPQALRLAARTTTPAATT